MRRWLLDHEGASQVWLEQFASGVAKADDPAAVRALASELLDARAMFAQLARAIRTIDGDEDEGGQ
jgi:hypothetical protein